MQHACSPATTLAFRTYFFNANTGLVSDIPMEAKPAVDAWGKITLE